MNDEPTTTKNTPQNHKNSKMLYPFMLNEKFLAMDKIHIDRCNIQILSEQ